MTHKFTRPLGVFGLTVLLVATTTGCELIYGLRHHRGSEGSAGHGGSGEADAGTASPVVSWSFAGLEPLGEDFVYEGWVIVDGSPVSTGRFSVDEYGMPSSEQFVLTAEQADGATKFVLSIEPAEDDDPGPAATKILAGGFVGGNATLTVADQAALGTDFDAIAGTYILNTPSTAGVSDDYHQGIWWLVPPSPDAPSASLSLPTLPLGWQYEGWVVGADGPISTGTFLAAEGADSDGAGPTAGPDSTPPFPGQDFVDPPLSLIGYKAVITVEPLPDNSPAPFTLKPLVDMDVEDLGAGVGQAMENNAAATNPSGAAYIE